MRHFTYKTSGTCSRSIDFDIDDNGALRNVRFTGGCNGNLQGICRLVEGQPAAHVSAVLKGVNCNGKGTSCPDQLARAVNDALAGA